MRRVTPQMTAHQGPRTIASSLPRCKTHSERIGMSGRRLESKGAHHGSPEVPVPQRRLLLLAPGVEGEHDQHQVLADPPQVPLDRLPNLEHDLRGLPRSTLGLGQS